MEFQVLGPFEVRREGGPVPLGPAKQRTLLAILLVRAIDENPAPTDSEWLIKRTGVPARLLARRRRFEEAERLAREGVAVAANCEFVVLHGRPARPGRGAASRRPAR
jgi:hypothetical protein